MKVSPKKPNPSETQTSLSDFLKSYNETIPQSFPRASETLLQKYKDEHAAFFKNGEFWSLDLHRKKMKHKIRQVSPDVKNIFKRTRVMP